MPRTLYLLALLSAVSLSIDPATGQERTIEAVPVPIAFGSTDWPWWRGPSQDGSADAEQRVPLTWSDSENVIWKAPVPGRGHSSPTVVGDQIFLTTSTNEPEVQSVLCYDRSSGDLRWKTDVHFGGFPEKMNAKASMASSTVACDGRFVFANFLNDGAVYTTALDLNGKKVWQTKITDYVIHQGYGSSPALYQSLVLVSADNKGGGAVAGLDRVTGDVVWKRDRPQLPNYPSPIVVHAAGRDQLILTGCDLITSLAPLTGETLWEIEGATTECVTSTVTDGNLVYSSGGYPRNHMSAVRADGSGEIIWNNATRLYVPSLLCHDRYLYGVLDAGIAMCWKAETGEELWRARLGGTFTASPVMVGERIYATNEEGQTFVFKRTPAKFELVAQNRLGELVYPTPTICGDRIYMRAATRQDDQWQETLYCLGNP
jgi:outer membrane protein assembly factor BamB